MESLYSRVGLIKVVNNLKPYVAIYLSVTVGLCTDFSCMIVELELIVKLYTYIDLCGILLY